MCCVNASLSLCVVSVDPMYHTPLTRLIVEDVQTQCRQLIQQAARAVLLGPHVVSGRDLRHRLQLSSLCQRLVVQRYSQKRDCQKQVMNFQQTLADAEIEPDMAMKKEMLAEASGRLKWCARLHWLPNEFELSESKSKPLPYYFKANDGQVITQAQIEKKKDGQ